MNSKKANVFPPEGRGTRCLWATLRQMKQAFMQCCVYSGLLLVPCTDEHFFLIIARPTIERPTHLLVCQIGNGPVNPKAT